jgi:simple sugar transport system permease protein
VKWAPAIKRFLVMVAVLVAALFITLLAFRLPIQGSLQLLFEGAFGDRFGWSRTAVKATPLLLTGLGMVVAWRGGVYNIGGEGQFIVGGLAGAWLAQYIPSTTSHSLAPVFQISILLACMSGGAFWAWIAGWLYVKRGVEVVIGTILLNFVAIQILGWAASGPLQEKAHEVPLTEQLPDWLMLPKWDRQMDLHLGVVVALFAAVCVYVFLFRTKAGFLLRLVGDSNRAARANRIDAGSIQIRTMLISGALCGLAGGIEYTGMAGQLGAGFSQQWGFLGIPVALLGGLHPLAVIASAFYFGALFAGSENLARYTDAGTTLIYVIQAVAVLAYVGVQAARQRQPAVREDT